MANPPRSDRPVTRPRIRITWVKSDIGYTQRQKDTIRGLGLRRLGQAVEKPATPAVLGMVSAVRHLVRVEDIGEE